MVSVQRAEESRKANQMHGLSRTLVNNMVVGVSEGYTKQLRRAQGPGCWPRGAVCLLTCGLFLLESRWRQVQVPAAAWCWTPQAAAGGSERSRQRAAGLWMPMCGAFHAGLKARGS